MLEKKYSQIILATGIETKTNEKLVDTNMLELENAHVFNASIRKTSGYKSLAEAQTVQSDPNDPKAVGYFNDNLLVVDNNNLYVYSDFSDELIKKDSLIFADVKNSVIQSNINELFYFRDILSGTTDIPNPVPLIASYDKFQANIYYNKSTNSYFISLFDENKQIQLFNGEIKTYTTGSDAYALINRSTRIEELIATPIGIFWYTLQDGTTGSAVNEYFLSYDLANQDSCLSPINTNIFPATTIRTTKSVTLSNINNYDRNLVGCYSGGSIILGFRIGDTPPVMTGALAVRSIGGQTITAPFSATDTFTITTIFSTRNLNLQAVTISDKEYVVFVAGNNVTPNKSIVLFDSTAHVPVATYGFSTNQISAINDSVGYLSKTNELVFLFHLIDEPFNLIMNKDAPYVQKLALDSSFVGTWGAELKDSRYIQYGSLSVGEFGYSCLAGAIFCDYDKCMFPIFYFPYLRSSIITDSPYNLTTPYPERRCHMLLVDENYNLISYLKSLNVGLANSDPVPNPVTTIGAFISWPSAVVKAKQKIDKNEIIYGAYLEASTVANKEEVRFTYNLSSFSCKFPSLLNFQTLPRGASCYLGHNLIYELTATTFSEQNWIDFPQILLKEITSGITTDLTDGLYQVAAIFEWTNGAGETVRSSPSIAKSIDIVQPISPSLPTAKIQVTLTIPPWFSKKKNFRIKIFRSTVNGTLLYLDNDILINEFPIADTNVQYFITKSDEEVIGNEILYTSGGVLPDFPFYDSKHFTLHKNNVWSISRENPYQVFFSKSFTPQLSLAAQPLFYVNVESLNGPVTALSSLDDKLVIAKSSYLYFLQGTGVDDTGAGQGFFVLDNIVSPVGCPHPQSIVRMPDGIMFLSNNGFWRLDRSLNTSYDGANAEKYNYVNVTSSILLRNQNKIKWSTIEGPLIEYDYYYKTWSIESKFSLDSIVQIKNTYYGITPEGELLESVNSLYKRNRVNYPVKITTPWFKFAGLIGYFRAYKMLFLGKYFGPHIIKISIYFNYSDTPSEFHYFNPAQNLGSGFAYGIGNWGQIVPYGGPAEGVYEFRVNFIRQKCKAFKITFEDVFVGDDLENGNSFEVTALTFEYGIKSGFDKLRVQQHAR